MQKQFRVCLPMKVQKRNEKKLRLRYTMEGLFYFQGGTVMNMPNEVSQAADLEQTYLNA